MTYEPKPMDTSNINLDTGILELTERLAKNSHEVWAAKRISEGWTYGTRRDDIQKHTPCLVPYEQLPESEKEYDRSLAIQTLKVIVALGYKVEKA